MTAADTNHNNSQSLANLLAWALAQEGINGLTQLLRAAPLLCRRCLKRCGLPDPSSVLGCRPERLQSLASILPPTSHEEPSKPVHQYARFWRLSDYVALHDGLP